MSTETQDLTDDEFFNEVQKWIRDPKGGTMVYVAKMMGLTHDAVKARWSRILARRKQQARAMLVNAPKQFIRVVSVKDIGRRGDLVRQVVAIDSTDGLDPRDVQRALRQALGDPHNPDGGEERIYDE